MRQNVGQAKKFLAVQTSSHFGVTSWALFRLFLAISGSLLGPFSSNFRQLGIISAEFG